MIQEMPSDFIAERVTTFWGGTGESKAGYVIAYRHNLASFYVERFIPHTELWYSNTKHVFIWKGSDGIYRAFKSDYFIASPTYFDSVIAEMLDNGMSLDDIFSYLELNHG